MGVTHAPASEQRRRRPDSDGDKVVAAGVLLAIVNAHGTIGADSAEQFEREVNRSLGAGATRLLVDLSRAGDLTSAAMNTLLAARQRLFTDGRVAVVLSPGMRRRFETLGLDRRFLIADSRMHAARLLGLADLTAPRTDAPRPHAHAA